MPYCNIAHYDTKDRTSFNPSDKQKASKVVRLLRFAYTYIFRELSDFQEINVFVSRRMYISIRTSRCIRRGTGLEYALVYSASKTQPHVTTNWPQTAGAILLSTTAFKKRPCAPPTRQSEVLIK